MKKVMLSIMLGIVTIATVNTAQAQVKLNVSMQPEWGPTGYNYAEYYYMPDIETYYNVPKKQYVHFADNRWVFSPALPPAYSNYDVYSGYKVVVNKPNAYKYFNDHKVKYARYKNYKNHQVILKNKHDNGNHYGQYKNKNKVNGKVKSPGNANGKGNSKGNGHGKGKH